MLVVFTAGIGFLLGASTFSWLEFLILCLGGFLVTGAANAFNQVIEKDFDKLMKRTEDRPLAAKRMTISEGVLAAGFMSLFGISLLALLNPLTALLGTFSLVIYAFIYTPVKRISPIAVLIGAIPGALPPMIGWTAATGTLGMEAFLIFGIQFLWQFPHFWAIAWLSHEDYTKAGYFLLPSPGGKDKATAFQCLLYALSLIPIGMIGYIFSIIGWFPAIIVTITGIVYTKAAWQLYQECSDEAARKLMFSSFFYLPITLLALLIGLL